MKVFILDVLSKSLEQMLLWLSEEKTVRGVQVFDNHLEFIEEVRKLPPDVCFIRLGRDSIPGFKVADMVRQINLDTRIVFVADDREYAVDAYEIGVYGYLLCPMSRKSFNNVLFAGI